jgi:hypothetical protein
MENAITMQQLANASADAQTLEVVVNGDENTDVTTRLGNTYPTLDKALKLIMRHGLVGSTPFKTYADLQKSMLADDSYAVVTNDTDTAKNGLWQKIQGAWVYSKYNNLPEVKAYVDEMISSKFAITTTKQTNAGNDIVFAFADEMDKVGVTFDSASNVNANNISSFDNLAYAYAIVDDNNQVAFAIDKNGNLVSDTLDTINATLDKLTNKHDKLQKTDYMHLFSYGQSLSRGATSRPIISMSQLYNNVTFKSGVLKRPSEGADYSDFIPLVESDNGYEGETPVSGFANSFVAIKVTNGEQASNWQFVGTASGMVGYDIDSLDKNTDFYNYLVGQIQAAYNIAQSKNKSYSVWAVAYAQGEQDYAINTSYDNYYKMLNQLFADIASDAKRITKQAFSPKFIIYQTAAHRIYNRNQMTIAQAQLDLSNNTDVIIATPIYQLPKSSDNLHLTADSSNQLGRYYAKALEYSYRTGNDFEPLQPIAIIAQGKIIDITFNKHDLTFDTSTLTNTKNKGFDIWVGDVVQEIISNVAIVDDNRVRIVLSSNIPLNATLSYAKGRIGDTVSLGNLRDNDDATGYTDSQGVKRYLNNWCVMFEQKIN